MSSFAYTDFDLPTTEGVVIHWVIRFQRVGKARLTFP